jgi:2-polyprenyl-3-methyl-5-hydroxy-6-metoxy-1,4-benzoquinol methylase
MARDPLHCGCCQGAHLVPILRAPDRAGEPVVVHHCQQCSALTPEYRFDPSGLIDRQTSFHERYWSCESSDNLAEAAQAMSGVLTFYSQHFDRIADGIVYDIGAGRGNLIALLLQRGYNAYACEPSEALSKAARTFFAIPSHRLITSSADNFLLHRVSDKGKVKVVFLWHVLEHLADPVGLLSQLEGYLADDGVIICQGPLLFPAYVYEEHCFFHSETNIRWLAGQSGLKLIMMECQSPERFASFVFANHRHPTKEAESVSLSHPLDAAGSLYFTLSHALIKLAARYDELDRSTKNPIRSVLPR